MTPDDPTAPYYWNTVATGSAGPGLRSRHCLAYDAGSGTTVLFGGIERRGSGNIVADGWELRKGSWSRLSSPGEPPARHRGAMVSDSQRGYAVMFGGQRDDLAMLGDTWTFTNRQWRQAAGGPTPRCAHVMAFDEEAGVAVVFGGVSKSQRPLGDTWVFDGSRWQQIMGPAPPRREYAALAYDPKLKGCILHGGAFNDDSATRFGDAWLFRDNTWTPLPEFDTEPRDDHAIPYRRSAKSLVMTEGLSGVNGMLVRQNMGWEPARVGLAPPHHQCSALAWDEGLNGLVMHGGELTPSGPATDATRVLRFRAAL